MALVTSTFRSLLSKKTIQRLAWRTNVPVRRPYQSAAMSTCPDLTAWAQGRIAALYEAKSDDSLHDAFESAISPSSEIFVNHEKMSRDSLKDDMLKRRGAAVSTSVKWENVIEVPKDPEKPYEVSST
jgi:hypothetical protein